MEAECFAASASKAVYLGRLASAVRAAAQNINTGKGAPQIAEPRSEPPTSCTINQHSTASDGIPKPTQPSSMAGSAFLGKALARLEELQPYSGGKLAEAIDWLQQLKASSVTADMLKENAVGKRLKAISKSKHQGISSQADSVVAEWKAQLLQA